MTDCVLPPDIQKLQDDAVNTIMDIQNRARRRDLVMGFLTGMFTGAGVVIVVVALQ